jgi:outer membrane protein OmpA-like peptidoglycan-associated protein
MSFSCRYLILLSPLLGLALLTHAQQRRQDSILVHFDLNKSNINPADTTQLSQALRHPGIDSVIITGYTDKTGTVFYNKGLSHRRAAAVADYFIVGTLRHRVTGGGIAPTPNQSDSANRRAEIIVYYTDADHGSPAPHYDTITRNARPHTPVAPSHPRPSDSIVVIKHPGSSGSPGSSGNPTADSATADSAQPSVVLALRRINFIVDTPVPTDSTRSILPEFIAELKQFKDHRLEIDGYVNSVVPLRGRNDPLYKLSVNRAKFIYNCLVAAGFDSTKLTYKGLGNSSPINPHPVTKEEMNANMRVEIKVY